MESTLLIVILTSIFNLWLTILIILHGKAHQTKRYFILMSLSILGWTTSNYLSNYIKEYQYALLWNKLIFVTTTLAAWSFLIFSSVFPNKKIISPKRIFYPSFSLMIAIIIISLSPYLVKDIVVKEKVSEINFGWGVYFYLVFLIGCLLGALFELVIKYFKTKEILIKQTLKLFLGGMMAFLILSISTNLVLPIFFKKFELTNLAPFYTVIFLAITLFSILRYEFLETKVILTEFFIGLIGITLLIFSFLLPGKYKFFGLVIFGLFCIFAHYLLKATYEESKRREEAERLAERERKLRLETERLAEAKDQFILSTQHYFRTPLTSILGYSSLILEGTYGELTPKLKEKISHIFTSAKELQKRVEEELSIAAFQTGKGILNLKETQLEDLVKKVYSDLKVQADIKKLEFELKLPKDPLPKIKVDPERMTEVFTNLIDNAIKHTREGKVEIELKKERNSILFSVKDTGIGIPSEELSTIGESAFERGKEAKKLTLMGKGIGLYLSKLIVKAHKGKLWAESEGRGKGSTFYVELPIR